MPRGYNEDGEKLPGNPNFKPQPFRESASWKEALAEAQEIEPEPSYTMIANVRAKQGLGKRKKMIELLKEGEGVTDAWMKAGFTRQAYGYNRKKHPDWASEIDYWNRAIHSSRYDDRKFDFKNYVKRWFPDRHEHKSHQIRIANELDSIGPREIKMFLIWPEAGKTATLEDYICMTLARDPSHRFRYVSEAQDLAKRVVGTIQRRMTDPLYKPWQDEFGPFYEKGQERNGRPWTSEQISLQGNESGERDRNLVASSWTSAVYGSRIDTLVLDDLQSQRNYVQAEEIFRRIRGTFFNRGIEMRTLIIGTRIGPGDVYERFLDAGLVHNPIILPAEDPATGDPTVPEFWERSLIHDGRACCAGFRTCPKNREKLTPREFMQLIQFQSGKETWAASYQQNPNANERTTFAEWLDQCLDNDRRYGKLLV